MFLFAAFSIRLGYGFNTKYLLVPAGLLSIYLLFVDGRPFLSSIAVGVSVRFWQLRAVFPLILLGEAIRRLTPNAPVPPPLR